MTIYGTFLFEGICSRKPHFFNFKCYLVCCFKVQEDASLSVVIIHYQLLGIIPGLRQVFLSLSSNIFQYNNKDNILKMFLQLAFEPIFY